MLTDKTTNR